jgi:hypothetical protein
MEYQAIHCPPPFSDGGGHFFAAYHGPSGASRRRL